MDNVVQKRTGKLGLVLTGLTVMLLAVVALAAGVDGHADEHVKVKPELLGLRVEAAREYVGFVPTPLKLNNAEVALQVRFILPPGAIDTIDTPEMLSTFGWPSDRRKLIGLAPPRLMTPEVKFDDEILRALDSLKRLHLQPGMGKLAEPVKFKEPADFTLPGAAAPNREVAEPKVNGKYIDYTLALNNGTVLTHRMFIFPLPLRVNDKGGQVLIRCSAIFLSRLGEPEDPAAMKDLFDSVQTALATLGVKLTPP